MIFLSDLQLPVSSKVILGFQLEYSGYRADTTGSVSGKTVLQNWSLYEIFWNENRPSLHNMLLELHSRRHTGSTAYPPDPYEPYMEYFNQMKILDAGQFNLKV
ncbi:hypothetical protein [Paenibacillus lacisoli]|uniref:hypothetical protein n=1 Tax=Paenibacillus lacisoli TaxID=3064525 RepID=UPI00272DB4C9|nr:hypothetical protein [Paenibacillus sp. JX-17]